MTTPALVAITPADAWQKVATSINSGRFIIKESDPRAYYYTYVDTGDAAPVGIPSASKVGVLFTDEVEFSNSVLSDFYIYCNGAIGAIETQL